MGKQVALDNFCELCYDGRLLLQDEHCPDCMRGAVQWPQSYKMLPKDCQHSGKFWCWMDACGIITREPALIDVLNGNVDPEGSYA
jgi:hypothetical protein